MNQVRVKKTVIIQNAQGLHARPADLFVRRAGEFEAQIMVIKGDQKIDGKSILDVMTLAAVQGTELEIEAVGSDAEEALDALARLIEDNFAELEDNQQN